MDNKAKQYLLAKKLKVRQHESFKEEVRRTSFQTKTFILPQDGLNNIFKTIISNENYKQTTGPKYNQQGDIVPYTLVGNPKWFQRNQKKKKGANFDDQIKQLPPTGNQVLKMNEEIKSMRNQSQKKNHRKVQLTTKGQLLDEMQAIKFRIDKNQQKQKDELELYDNVARNYLTKSERLFEKHQSTLNFWEDMTNKQAAKLNRLPEQSQLVKSEDYQAKMEIVSNFEAVKNKFEQFGSRIWYMTLRESANVPQPVDVKYIHGQEIKVEKQLELPLIINEDIPNAFKHSSVNGVKQGIQYIRKPNLPERLKTLSTNSQTYLHTLNGSINSGNDIYLNNKLNSTKNTFHENFMLDYEQAKNLDDLIVIGKNQFQLEQDSLVNDGSDNTAVYRKYLDVLEVQDEEEIVNDQAKLEKIFLKKKKHSLPQKQSSVSEHTNNNLTQTDFF